MPGRSLLKTLLLIVISSSFVTVANAQPNATKFQSKISVVNQALQEELDKVVRIENQERRGMLIASHRTALAAQLTDVLIKYKCKTPSVSVASSPFGLPTENGDDYVIQSENCRVLKNSEGNCESGFDVKGIQLPGFEKHKVCIQAEPSAVEANQNGEAVP
jgi:hypothetical protein